MRSRLWMVVLALLMLAPRAVEAAPGFTLMSWAWLRAPFTWLAHSEPVPKVPCNGPGCFELLGPQGFHRFAFDEPTEGRGLYVDLDGSVQFRSAEITFADGEVDRLDLQYATRTDGIFELRDFGRDRTVLNVLLIARAASPRATIRVRFGQHLE